MDIDGLDGVGTSGAPRQPQPQPLPQPQPQPPGRPGGTAVAADPAEAPVPVAWERTDLRDVPESADHDWAATEIIPARPELVTGAAEGIAHTAPPPWPFETAPLDTAPPRRTPAGAPRPATAGPTLTPVGAAGEATPLPAWARNPRPPAPETAPEPGEADPNAWRTPRWAAARGVPIAEPPPWPFHPTDPGSTGDAECPPAPSAADLGEDSGPLPAPPPPVRAERSAPVPPVLPRPAARDVPPPAPTGNFEPTVPLPRVPKLADPPPERAATPAPPPEVRAETPSSSAERSPDPAPETTPGGRPRLHVGPATRWVPPARTPAPDPAWQRQSSSGFGPPPFDSGLHRRTGPRIPAPTGGTGPYPNPGYAPERTDWGTGYTTDPAWSIEPTGYGPRYDAEEPVQRLVNQLASIGAVVLLVSAVLLSLSVIGVGIGFTVSRVPNGAPPAVSGSP